MPEISITPLPNSEVKIAFVVSLEEAQPYLEEAVADFSKHRPVPGFRPGKLPFAEGKRVYGEMPILEAAFERIVRAFYVRTILEEKLDVVASPAVNVDQLTPGQPIKFTVTAPTEPRVTKMPDLSKCVVEYTEKPIEEKHVDETVEEIRKMRRVEVIADRPATAEDLVIIDLDMKKDNVILEGGSGKDYRVYLKEPHYIPGFSEKLLGIKASEERAFTLPFPEEHYQKHLAGKQIDFTAIAKGVYELQLPEANDDFAKSVGAEDLVDLRKKLKENLTVEAKHKLDEANEIAMLEKLVETASFDGIPEILINEEIRRMLQELQSGVEEQGGKWEDYLANIKKTTDQLKLDFIPQALRRVRTAVLIKAFAKEAKIAVDDEEINHEIDHILEQVRENDRETRERVASPEYREYVTVQMRNRKTLTWLKEQCVKNVGA